MYIITGHEQFREALVVLICIFFFLVLSIVCLLNLLVAQLTRAYTSIYMGMVGFARLERMPRVFHTQWIGFVQSLHPDKCLEFNEGDLGLSEGHPVIDKRRPAAATCGLCAWEGSNNFKVSTNEFAPGRRASTLPGLVALKAQGGRKQ